MGLVQNLQLLNIKLVCWLGWLSCFAFAQFDISEGVSGFVNIPVQGITCLGNLAVFVTSLIRGRLDLEIGARDVLDILLSAKLKTINGIGDGNGLTTYTEGRQTASAERVCFQKMIQLCRRLRHRLGIQKMVELFRRLRHQLGIEKMVEFFRRFQHRLGINVPCSRGEEDLQTLSIEQGDLHIASAEEGPQAPPTTSNENGSVQPTASVVMLSNGKPNLSIKEFMKTNAPIVDSILLRFLPLQDAINDGEVVTPEVNIETCPCNSCNCIVFWTLEEKRVRSYSLAYPMGRCGSHAGIWETGIRCCSNPCVGEMDNWQLYSEQEEFARIYGEKSSRLGTSGILFCVLSQRRPGRSSKHVGCAMDIYYFKKTPLLRYN